MRHQKDITSEKSTINIFGMPTTVEQLTHDLVSMFATSRISLDDYLSIWAALVDKVIPQGEDPWIAVIKRLGIA